MATFNKWLRKQAKRDDPVGDLAQDVMRDDRPVPHNTRGAWQSWLWFAGATTEAMQAFAEAWREYEYETD